MDEDEINLPNHLFISLRHKFKATRVMGRKLSPTTIKVKVDISPLDEDTDEYAHKMEVALAKMNYFVERVLSETVIFSWDNEWAMDCFFQDRELSTNNTVMVCPEEPTDALLCEVLLCKFKALTQGIFEFHSIEIESNDSRDMSFMFVGSNPGESFPGPEDWLSERNFFSKPWWNRSDASSLDIIPDEDDDLNEIPTWAYSLGFIAERLADDSLPNNVVVRPEFRPQVIEGGKTD
jgi:hypothetical protein